MNKSAGRGVDVDAMNFSGSPVFRYLLWLSVSLLSLMAFVSEAMPQNMPPSRSGTPQPQQVFGRIQVVDHFPDVRVRVVRGIADMEVRVVDALPNRQGRWQFVDHFPDFRVQFVQHHADFTVRLVGPNGRPVDPPAATGRRGAAAPGTGEPTPRR